MICDLTIVSNGDYTSVEGTVQIEYSLDQEPISFNHTVQIEGDGGDRGNYAKVDGNEQWWVGADMNKHGTQKLEQTIEDLYESVWDQVNKEFDAEQPWRARVKDGKVVEVNRIGDNG